MSLIDNKNLETVLSGVKTYIDSQDGIQVDWNQNDPSADSYVKNRTHYDSRALETVSIDFDGNIENKEYIEMVPNVQYMVKLSDLTPAVTDLIGGTFSEFLYDRVEEPIVIGEDMLKQVNPSFYLVGPGSPIVVALEDDVKFAGGKLSKGIWTLCEMSPDETGAYVSDHYICNLFYTKSIGELKKLDAKYLPDDIHVQSDWNEADETAKSFIKNKPFYDIATPAVLFSTSNAPTSGQANARLGVISIPFVEGEYYTVTINNVDIEIQCKRGPDGNLHLFKPENVEENIFNGSIYQNPDTLELCAFTWWISGSTLSITGYAHDIKTIDKKYLPGLVGVKIPGGGEAFNDSNCKATGRFSHAEGATTYAYGVASHSEGNSTYASGDYSHAEGFRTEASGDYSHAEGNKTIASGDYSHAEGNETTASGDYSHAEGFKTKVSGDYSHSEGYYTESNSNFQHTQGKFNIRDIDGKYAHIVGNGTKEVERSNAHTLDWEGNAWFQGEVYTGGTGQDDEKAVRLLKESEIATDDEIIELLAQEDMLPTVTDSDGSFLADENENILLW